MAEKAKKFYSKKQEKMVADELGGYPIGGSGAMPGAPGDVKTYDWLVECKTHTEPGKSIAFNVAVWNKIKNEAMANHKKPVLIVDDGSQSRSKTWCLCRSSNINQGSVVSAPFPVSIRKNITAKHEKLEKSLKDATDRYLGEFYQFGVFEANWEGEDVTIMPLSVFKELMDN